MSSSSPQLFVGSVIFGPEKNKAYNIPLGDVVRHTLVVGSTGSGKSVAMKALCEEAIFHGIPTVAIDIMGDLAGMALPLGSGREYSKYKIEAPIVNDDDWVIGDYVAKRLRPVIEPRILTPWSNVGDRLAIPLLMSRPEIYDILNASDEGRDLLMIQADTIAIGVLQRLGYGMTNGKPSPELAVVTEGVLHAWRENINLDGVQGVSRFVEILDNMSQSVLSEKQVGNMLTKLRTLLIGANVLWFQGIPMDWNKILAHSPGKVPVVIIQLNNISRELHPWTVGQIIQSLANWCSSKGASPGKPRVCLLVDELAGEGGQMALLPPGNQRANPSGSAIKRVLRQGRHFGLSLLAGTQSAGDVDYKSFSNFNLKIIGKQQTRTEIDRCLESVSMGEQGKNKLAQYITNAKSGEFFIIPPGRPWSAVKIRWLGSCHTKLETQQIEHLYASGVIKRLGNATTDPNMKFAEILENISRTHDAVIGNETRDEIGKIIARKKKTKVKDLKDATEIAK